MGVFEANKAPAIGRSLGVAGLLLLTTAAGALAQGAPEGGVRAGSFIIEPQLTLDTEYNDNYLGRAVNEQDTFIHTVAPRVEMRSDWNRHAFRLGFGGSAGFHSEDSDDDYIDYGADAGLQLDATRALRFSFDLGANRHHEGRDSDNTAGNAAEVTEFSRYGGAARADYKPGMIRVSPFGSYDVYDYDDAGSVTGGSINQDDRDRQQFGYGLEVGYEFMRGYEAFVMGAGGHTNFDDAVDDNGDNRDSSTYRALVGANIALTRLIEGRVGVGYATRENDGSRFGDDSGVTVDVGLDWSVTPLTTVDISASQSFQETTTGGSGNTNVLGGRIGVTHDLLRNVQVDAFVGAQQEDFEGTSRTDTTLEAGVGAAYAINRYFSLGARYSFTYEDPDPLSDYTVNRLGIGLTAKY